MSNVAQITVPFHNNNLYIVEFNGQPYTPLRQIVQGMGLDWASQFTKIKQKFATCVVEITMQILGDDQSRPHTCIPVRKLAAWLYSVNPNKVKPELRDNVIMYQSECDDVLWDYWTKGQAINQRAAITPEQQALLHEIVARRSNGERKIFAEMWSRHNKHFKIPRYSELLAIHFPESVHYLETMEIKSKPEQIEQKDVVGKLDEYLKTLDSRFPALSNPIAYEIGQKISQFLQYQDLSDERLFYTVSINSGQVVVMPQSAHHCSLDIVKLSDAFAPLWEFMQGYEVRHRANHLRKLPLKRIPNK
ncbi:hypothetical protein HIN86_15360 [Acinetobacter baumannii]|nr:hypothetical protein HIN87_10630 [Acinetobacter baumannii]QJF37482.1 hypothetical protein HIN86_15360 [Acinetobacter baumannii]